MANYCGMVRTNYFKIKSEEAFRKACENLVGECNIEVEVSKKGGQLYGWIGSYSSIDYCTNEDEYELGDFFKAMQGVIADDDAMLWTEIGNEKLRYLVGMCTIVTSTSVDYIDVENTSIEKAREMLGNPDWVTKNNY